VTIREEFDAARDLTVYTVHQALDFDELYALLERVYARPE
jgi:hypothetical protein